MERFRGNNIDPELEYEYGDWLLYVDTIFLPLIDSDTGSFLHYPYERSYMELPNKLMTLLTRIQCYYKRSRYERVQKMRM